ncbi:hypothetical protein [Micromonospora sp. DT62]|uniref:hypothetical protein n=1 Tax=Micromonospora sp. DT62 TaxID=3416521 RepID=UPI003CEDD9A0
MELFERLARLEAWIVELGRYNAGLRLRAGWTTRWGAAGQRLLAAQDPADTARADRRAGVEAQVPAKQTGLFRQAALVAVRCHQHETSKTGRR